MTWLMAIIGTVGFFLNIRKHWAGYLLWVITSGYWCWRDVTIGEYAQAVMVGAFGIVALCGMIIWLPKKKTKPGHPFVEFTGGSSETAKLSELTYQGDIQDAEIIRELKHRLESTYRVTGKLLWEHRRDKPPVTRIRRIKKTN